MPYFASISGFPAVSMCIEIPRKLETAGHGPLTIEQHLLCVIILRRIEIFWKPSRDRYRRRPPRFPGSDEIIYWRCIPMGIVPPIPTPIPCWTLFAGIPKTLPCPCADTGFPWLNPHSSLMNAKWFDAELWLSARHIGLESDEKQPLSSLWNRCSKNAPNG